MPEALVILLAAISMPAFIAFMFLLRGIFIVEPKQAFIILYWGKYSRTISEPGIHFAFPIGLSWRQVSLRDSIFAMPQTTVVDALGNPIQVSAVCVYRVVDPARALLEVNNYAAYIGNQASAVLKAVCSRYPYENRAGEHPSLKNESQEIIRALTVQLQDQVQTAGIQVVLVRLNDLAYAPEIAQAMLLRQQAQALVDARRTLVEGAVDTVGDGVERLAKAGISLSPLQRTHLITNLTLLLCAGERGENTASATSRDRIEKKGHSGGYAGYPSY